MKLGIDASWASSLSATASAGVYAEELRPGGGAGGGGGRLGGVALERPHRSWHGRRPLGSHRRSERQESINVAGHGAQDHSSRLQGHEKAANRTVWNTGSNYFVRDMGCSCE